MARGKPSNGSPIDPDFTRDVKLVDDKCQHPFRVPLALVRIEILPEALTGVTIASVVPAHNVDLTLEEKVEPVRIWRRNHLLVDHGVGVAHDDGWLAEVLLSLECLRFLFNSKRRTMRFLQAHSIVFGVADNLTCERSIDVLLLVNSHFFTLCAREEHAGG